MAKNSEAAIGVFDSGVGGLTVMREIMYQMPEEKIVYFGDTARVPYGTKSKENIIRYSKQNIRFLQTKNVKAIVVACNTASALALDEVKEELDIPIIGVVRPGARVAAATTENGRVGVIATQATIGSEIYTKVIQEKHPEIEVFGKACPLFVPLVEEGLTEDCVTEEIARRYLCELQEKDIDTLILGCTHYPLLKKIVGKVMGETISLVNPAYETALELKKLLQEEGLLFRGNRTTSHKYDCYVSDGADNFRHFAKSILPYETEDTKQIQIEEY